jgi:two-component system KDP operon response regulator KdpE
VERWTVAGAEYTMWRIIEVGDFRVDPYRFRASIRNRQIRLTPKEFKLLLYLARHASCIVTHQKLALAIWGANTNGQRERLRVLVRQLRKKIEILGAPQYIVTEPWIGYRFEPAGEVSSPELQEDQLQA